jgi:hypothetical protein
LRPALRLKALIQNVEYEERRGSLVSMTQSSKALSSSPTVLVHEEITQQQRPKFCEHSKTVPSGCSLSFSFFFFRPDCVLHLREPSTELVYRPTCVKVDTVCVTAVDDTSGFMRDVGRAFRDNTMAFNFGEQCAVISLPFGMASGYFPILIHVSKKDNKSTEDDEDDEDYHGLHHDKYQNQADFASACALYQQRYFGMRPPLYQIMFEEKTAQVMRCFWDIKKGVTYFERSIATSVRSFDLTRPAEMLEFFLIIVNIMKYLPEVYAKSAFDFQSEVASGRWQANRPS